MKYSFLDILYIEWLDSTTQSDWYDKDEIEDLLEVDLKCRSVGFYIGETEKSITIAQNTSPTQIGDFITIPKATITKIEECLLKGKE
jgi:hypothetical protein